MASNISKQIKIVDKLFSSPTFMEELSKACYNDYDLIVQNMGQVLGYYLATRSTTPMTFEQIHKEILTYNYTVKNQGKNETTQEALRRNLIDEGYLSHSFNGYNFKKTKKFGLGSDKVYDQELAKDIDALERYIGRSEYMEHQNGSSNEIYLTSPGSKTIHYASSLSPERLLLGPLNQSRKDALPIIVGESKKDYMLRVVRDKINKHYTVQEQEEIMKVADRVLSKLCTKKPVAAFVPIYDKFYHQYFGEDQIHAAHATLEYGMGRIDDTIKGITNPIEFITTNTDLIETNNMGNLVVGGVVFPPKFLTFLELPDKFDIMQHMAKAQGLKKGDKMDYFTGQRVIEKENKVEETKETSASLEQKHEQAKTLPSKKTEDKPFEI